MKTTQQNLTPPKPSKIKAKKPVAKPKSRVPSYHMATEEGIWFFVANSHWLIKTNGELIVKTGEHVFKCSWGMDGSVYAHLYPDMSEYASALNYILTQPMMIEWLALHNKRVTPKELKLDKK